MVVNFKPETVRRIVSSVLLFYLGYNRKSPAIQENLRNLTPDQINYLHKIKAVIVEALEPVDRGDIEKVGQLLTKLWVIKKRANPLACDERIDKALTLGEKHGAFGGKVQGAGGGGFMIFVVDPDKKNKFIERMEREGYKWQDYNLSLDGVQTRICPD